MEEVVEAEAIVIALQPKQKRSGRPRYIEKVRVITPVPVKDALLEPVIIRKSS